MDRRWFVLAAVLASLLAAMPARAQTESEEVWMFTKWSEIFDKLREATTPFADGVTKIRFIRLLNEMNVDFFEVLDAKRNMLRELQSVNCSAGPASLNDVIQARDKLPPVMAAFSRNTRALAVSIKPAAVRDEVVEIADRLQGAQGIRTSLMGRIHEYCTFDADEKNRLLEELKMTISTVKLSRSTLDRLRTKLEQ